MKKFTLPWEEEPIATIISLFGCVVQHVEPIKEDSSIGEEDAEDHEG